MALNKVEICGVNTSSLPVLKPDEKEALFQKIKKGDSQAREQYIKGNLRLVLSVIKRFQNSNENADEIATEIGIDKEMVVYALDAIQSPVSLFEPVYSEGGDTLYVMDQISDQKNKEDHWLENLSLREAMNRLNQREKHIIEMRFYEGKTQMEVADEIGISQAQVSRLEKNALKTMKNYLRT